MSKWVVKVMGLDRYNAFNHIVNTIEDKMHVLEIIGPFDSEKECDIWIGKQEERAFTVFVPEKLIPVTKPITLHLMSKP